MNEVKSRFDWYEATFEGRELDHVAATLSIRSNGKISRGKGRNGYAECFNIDRDGEALVKVYGRSARADEIHLVTTSDACDELVPIIRDLYPEHRVSRADSSIDFSADFSILDQLAVAFAANRRLSYRLVSDSDGGATRYLGAPSSELRTRVYKKSEQLRSLHPDRAQEIPDGIVRAELQARPGKRDIKSAVAQMSADDLWGLGQWTKDFAAELLHIQAPRLATHFRRPSDWSRALHFLNHQYAPMILRRVGEAGYDEVRTEVLAALGLDAP